MSRLREGRANTARGAAHFLRETVGRVRYGGARGQLTVRPTVASMPTPWSRSAAKWMSASPSPSASTKACTILLRRYPRRTGRRSPTGWMAPPRWRRPPTPPSRMSPTPPPVRLIVRRVKPTPGSQLALFASYSYHGFITDRDGATLELERSAADCEHENHHVELLSTVPLTDVSSQPPPHKWEE